MCCLLRLLSLSGLLPRLIVAGETGLQVLISKSRMVECAADMNKNTGALSFSPIPQNDLDPLDGFYVVPIEIDAERALDWLDGNDKIT